MPLQSYLGRLADIVGQLEAASGGVQGTLNHDLHYSLPSLAAGRCLTSHPYRCRQISFSLSLGWLRATLRNPTQGEENEGTTRRKVEDTQKTRRRNTQITVTTHRNYSARHFNISRLGLTSVANHATAELDATGSTFPPTTQLPL